MPVQQTYYLNAPTLALATAVFLDSGMTLCAPDGYYSDGTTARQQVGCKLLPAEACPDCGDGCVGGISELMSTEGVYYTSFDAGVSIGAIIVTVLLDNSVNGIKAEYDGDTFNELSSPTYGYLAGIPGTGPTYIGGVPYDCGIEGTPYTLDEYEYVDPAYSPLGTTTSITPLAAELALTAFDPGICVMVIPKTTAAPANIDITVIGPCPGSVLYMSVSCPIELPGFSATYGTSLVVPEVFCLLPYSQTYYIAPVNGDGITLGLYDWVFTDQNGANKLADGYYRSMNIPAPYDTFRIQDGVIISFHTYCEEYY